MPTNNYFAAKNPAGYVSHFTFDDKSEASTRDAFAAAKRVTGEDGELAIMRPVVWVLRADMGIIGRVSVVRFKHDNVWPGMRLQCRLCGVSVAVKEVSARDREWQLDQFEDVHAPHWHEQLEREAAAHRMAVAEARKKDAA